jgi:hypothetical protein
MTREENRENLRNLIVGRKIKDVKFYDELVSIQFDDGCSMIVSNGKCLNTCFRSY